MNAGSGPSCYFANGARTRYASDEATRMAVASRHSPGRAGRFHRKTVRSPIAVSVIRPPRPDNGIAAKPLRRTPVFLLTSLTTANSHWPAFDEDSTEFASGHDDRRIGEARLAASRPAVTLPPKDDNRAKRGWSVR